jgi:ElaB/YqjD/DUF883 family membrane-anchored ribosome-binding protein
METTTTKPEANNGRLAQSMRHMVDEAEHLLHEAVDSGDAKFDAMRLQFGQQLKRLRTQLDDFEDNAVHKARQAARAADQTVQAHPYGAMGLAATVGLLIGVLVARR